MNFRVNKSTRNYAQAITGHAYDDLILMPLEEGEKVNPDNFSPFRDSGAREIPSRGSVYLQMNRVAKLKEVSRRFFNF